MKIIGRLLLGLFSLIFPILLSAKGPEMKLLDKRILDYGDAKAGEPLEIKFRFKNTGEEPLKILEVHKSCTCTDVLFPSEEIPPGKEGEIIFQVETKGKRGFQTLVVSLDLNTPRGYEILRVNINYI